MIILIEIYNTVENCFRYMHVIDNMAGKFEISYTEKGHENSAFFLSMDKHRTVMQLHGNDKHQNDTHTHTFITY